MTKEESTKLFLALTRFMNESRPQDAHNTLKWLWSELARDPEAQQDVRFRLGKIRGVTSAEIAALATWPCDHAPARAMISGLEPVAAVQACRNLITAFLPELDPPTEQTK